MAQLVSTRTSKTYGKKEEPKNAVPLFRTVNYILMAVGVIVLIAGYFALAGGKAEDPNVFNEAIFDTRRLVVAPILMVAGLVIEIFAIMWRPFSCKKQDNPEQTAE